MSNNKEKRTPQEKIHLYLALERTGTAKDKKCMRQVIKDEELDLKILEAKCRVFGGEWRIHKTVNARDPEKARKWLLKHLIDFPEHASTIDSEWRTALMQRECKVTKYFMLDVDTTDVDKLIIINRELEKEKANEHFRIASPKGYHIITEPFDTRTICDSYLKEWCTLLRDGYYYVKTVGDKK
jgi:hypothetical protein